MKISKIQRKDIDSCAFLLKCLQSAKYEIEGSAVATMHDCYGWVHNLSVALADGWNEQNKTVNAPEGPKNVKVTNPKGNI
jgi:hypothetical protein